MFILTKVADLVQIAPAQFEKHSSVAIEDNINAKYSNRVIQKIGLCICMYDLLYATEGLIGHGTGLVNVNGIQPLIELGEREGGDADSAAVEFRLIVFRPFKGETLLGKISSATPEGINVRTDFFEDIFVPYKELPESCEFDHNEQLWVWVMDGQRMYYDKNEMVRLQVIDEEWHDQVPDNTTDEAVEEARKSSPYKIVGTMMKEGLGPCLWWD